MHVCQALSTGFRKMLSVQAGSFLQIRLILFRLPSFLHARVRSFGFSFVFGSGSARCRLCEHVELISSRCSGLSLGETWSRRAVAKCVLHVLVFSLLNGR